MENPCKKCLSFIHDTLVQPLPPSDPFYTIFNFRRVYPIASELTRDIFRILILMGDNMYINLPASKELVYPTLLCIESGFARCNENLSKNIIPTTRQYLQRICVSLKMEIEEIHQEHCGLVLVKPKENLNDLYA